jgi:hypothetical protein
LEDFFDYNEAKAIVYLLSEGDNKNKVLISDDQLLVIHKNQKQILALKDISKLESAHKKMLLPLILGGIITPFAFLSYFVNLFHPWIHLFSILAGMFLFYYGWMGKSAFTIVFKKGDELIYYLPSISKNLDAFMDFANALLHDSNYSGLRDLLFFKIDKKYESLLIGEDRKMKSQELFPVVGSTYAQLRNYANSDHETKIIAINPVDAGREIKFTFDLKTNEMRPKLEGPVRKESIVNVSNYQPKSI